MTSFLAVQPTDHNRFRAIVLFGRNVASYKFALAHALLELADQPDDLVKLEDLAEPYARHLCAHLARAPKQATSKTSRFLEACRRANAGEGSVDKLIAMTVSLGFNNVIDAFHRLGSADIERRFFIDERTPKGSIRLTDALRELIADRSTDLAHETEARWQLVETAWELGVSSPLIGYDPDLGTLTAMRGGRRIAITSSRAALNGYQKGCCFYCFAAVTLNGGTNSADVDHFFPWSLRRLLVGNVDGVWNLVLSCRGCNRGADGKFDCVPALDLVARLHRRNEFLITSHHPLRETLIAQTGATEAARAAYLQANYAAALTQRVAQWNATARAEVAF